MKKAFLVFFLVFIAYQVHCQFTFPPNGEVYNDSVLPRIDIIMEPDSLNAMYGSPDSDHEYPVTFIFHKTAVPDTFYNVGFRIRGNTSRFSGKKSFKISINTFVKGRKYYSVEKLNLNGEHNDPSVIRSKLAWNLLRKMNVPAPRANHVEVYINRKYYGLYINVEHIDENFVKSRYGNNNGNLFKCLYPADLVFISNNASDYKLLFNNYRIYDLNTNKDIDDYSDLASFINILNNTPDGTFKEEIEKVFDVDNFLKAMAVDVLISNWDGYAFNKNNFYLYHNLVSGKFEYLPYDLDNTFGIDWFGVDWAKRDINNWASDENRPLFKKIMKVQAYRDQFNLYVQELLQKYFNPGKMNPEIDAIKEMITEPAWNDTYRTLDYGWNTDDFTNSYDMSLGQHVKYGLKQYIEARYNSALTQLQLPSGVQFSNTGIEVYPNPFHGELNIKLSGLNSFPIKMAVLDATGRIVYAGSLQGKGTSSIKWSANDSRGNRLPNGLYIVSLTYGSSDVQYKTKVILVQ